MTRIRLSPSASVTPTTAGVVLRSDLGAFQLDGEDVRLFVTEMLPLLDGSRDAEGVADALPRTSRTSVVGFLELLRQRGLIEDVPEVPDAAGEARQVQERFFQKCGLGPGEGTARLRAARVVIAGLEPWGAVAAQELAAAGAGALHLLDDQWVTAGDLLAVRTWDASHLGQPRREALKAAITKVAPDCVVTTAPLAPQDGGEIAIEGGSWDLLITGLTADDLFLLTRLARFAQAAGLRSVYAHLDGVEAWIGPAVVPGETACWNCFRLRRLANTGFETTSHEVEGSLLAAPAPPRARGYLAPMAPAAGQLLALEAIKLLTGYTASRLPGRFLVQNLVSGEGAWHGVVRMPWCELCGGAAVAAASPNPGGAVPGGGAGGGLGSVRDTEGLRELLSGWVDDRVGIIRSLVTAQGSADDAGLELPVAATAYLASYTEGRLRHVHDPQVASGKGLTAVDALIGAVGEAIERYSAARYRREDLRLASWNGLGEEGFDPRQLCLYDEEQYREPGFPFAPFDPDRPIHWLRGSWLGSGEPVWVPALTSFFNFMADPGEHFCQVSSNGLAAGGGLEDAALRALFELVERDAFMLTWLCRLPARRIVPDGALEPGVREIVRQLGERGAAVELYLLDAGTGIPTALCLGVGDGERWPAVTVALACHTDLRTAVRKAILEQGHVGPYIQRLMRESKVPATPEEVLSLEDHALYYVTPERMGAFDFLRRPGDADQDAVILADVAPAPSPTAASCAERLSAAGLRVAIADVTSPDVTASPFRVARALGTNMQPIHFGERFRRLANPRLQAHLTSRGVNPDPHPVA
ncbi:MAG TPA: TOMM precursor leader peptide-binding protein [Thermoanaerobaculia bacterium]|jgi:ribosomal protein S12 methylthiotransferase accessory factor|nr:TOMM precursor leader peptide-binding protein [Thermoanaerobaculia bacterium]